ncbi:hypothetical protein DDJ70_25255 [Klebsiella michiganensis]|uniref:Integrase n=1 Tax=Klebsiella michiganensis TaxID=1134687 RepID=A0A2J4YR85_9ENTR|nr:hypothetical protein CWM85_25505 [Klebsiella michiganensis]RFC03821.1 hypothetical protein DDJ70_25255 [Klebsiella michiganensis]
MPLNDTKIRSLKSSAKPFKVSDSRGLYLLVNPGGSIITLNLLSGAELRASRCNTPPGFSYCSVIGGNR